MKGAYLRQRWRLMASYALFAGIFLITFRLYGLPLQAAAYPALLCALIGMAFLLTGYLREKRKHAALASIRTIADATENALPAADTQAEADYQAILRLMEKEHQQYATGASQAYADMVDYYTVWAHQIKTPIASMRLHLQAEDSAASRKLSADLQRVGQYVEMVLAFLRLGSESTDYVIRPYALDPIIQQAVKKFAPEFISRKLRLLYEPVDATVITDEKWLAFVVEQILSNALKYTRKGSITIAMEPGNQLIIRDTGMGIAPEDLPRSVENGYTGLSGRTDKKASGIGLYLCRRILGNLGHGISATSTPDVGTTITIDLSQTSLQVE